MYKLWRLSFFIYKSHHPTIEKRVNLKFKYFRVVLSIKAIRSDFDAAILQKYQSNFKFKRSGRILAVASDRSCSTDQHQSYSADFSVCYFYLLIK